LHKWSLRSNEAALSDSRSILHTLEELYGDEAFEDQSGNFLKTDKGDEEESEVYKHCLVGNACGNLIPLLYTDPINKPADNAFVGKIPIRLGIV